MPLGAVGHLRRPSPLATPEPVWRGEVDAPKGLLETAASIHHKECAPIR